MVKRTIPTSFFDVDLIEIAEVFVARITSDYDIRYSFPETYLPQIRITPEKSVSYRASA